MSGTTKHRGPSAVSPSQPGGKAALHLWMKEWREKCPAPESSNTVFVYSHPG